MTKYVRLAREDNSLNSQCTFHLESIYFANNLFVDKLVIISTLCEFSHCMGLAKGLKQPCPQLFLIKKIIKSARKLHDWFLLSTT
jgi:hypothetical protein